MVEKDSDQVLVVQSERRRLIPKRYLGVLLALLASILFPLAGMVVKALKDYHPFNVAFWRFQGILIPAIPMAFCRRSIITSTTTTTTSESGGDDIIITKADNKTKDIWAPLRGPKARANILLMMV
jgi:hypothetical protein